MADYPKMYKTLFQAVTEAIEILQKAQISAEELYITAEDTVLTLLPEKDDENRNDKYSPNGQPPTI